MPLERIAKKILLVGWDAADWKILSPMLDAGQMPTLARFVQNGVMGNIATLQPCLSPILWTTIATGKRPDKHGILGFVEPVPDGGGIRPVSSTSRKTKALWNILTQNGLKTHVVGWYASHPAEPINGVCVSNAFEEPAGPPDKPWPVPPGSVHPKHMEERLAELRVHPGEMTANHLGPFIPRLKEIDLKKDQRPLKLARLIARCSSVHAVATEILEKEEWDFLGVYYDAIDLVGHFFMPFHPPRQPHVPEADFELYKEVVTGIYRFHDMMLARLLNLAGPDVTVILVSDHGFHSDHLRPPTIDDGLTGQAPAWHRPYGVISMKGPKIRADERIFGATLLDVTPTVLTLFGLPVGEDMDGKVLVEAFTEPLEIDRIPSWDTVAGEAGLHPPDLRQDPVEARQALGQLVALGYIAEPTADEQKNAEEGTRELRYNLAISHFHAGRPDLALPILQGLHESQPDMERFRGLMAQCLLQLGRQAEAKPFIEGMVAAGKETAAGQMMLANVCFAQGKPDQALELLAQAEQSQSSSADFQCQLGNVYLFRQRWADGERVFRRALEIDPDNAHAYLGLAQAMLGKGDAEQAAEHALQAVSLMHFFPQAHYCLGQALVRLGSYDRAIQAFELVVRMAPGAMDAHRYLATLHRNLGNSEKAYRHRRVVEVMAARMAEAAR